MNEILEKLEEIQKRTNIVLQELDEREQVIYNDYKKQLKPILKLKFECYDIIREVISLEVDIRGRVNNDV